MYTCVYVVNFVKRQGTFKARHANVCALHTVHTYIYTYIHM